MLYGNIDQNYSKFDKKRIGKLTKIIKKLEPLLQEKDQKKSIIWDK